jgi:hypothetical protein
VEIEFPRRSLVALGCVLVALVLILVGLAVSPRIDGHPLLLSPQRRAILHYMNWCRGWADRLAELESRLDGLMPEPESAVATVQPAPSPGDLYHRAQQAEAALRTATVLQLEAERAAVPVPMVGLHNLVSASAQAHIAWAEAVAAYVGAPSSETASGLAELRQAAVETLASLEEALDDAD